MKQRTITGFFILLVTALAIVGKLLPHNIGDYIFDVFVLIIAIIAASEMSNIMNKKGTKVNSSMTMIFPLFAYILLIFILDYLDFALLVSVEILGLFIYFAITFIVELIKNKDYGAKDNLSTALNTTISCLYPSLFLILMCCINHSDIYAGIPHFSIAFVVLIFAITYTTDVMAYLVGRTFKGPKMAPRISPNKTISGGIGGLFGGAIGALLVYLLISNTSLQTILNMYDLSWWHFGLIGLIGSAIGQAGDLFESSLKRQANIKDSGNLFPGHGGMLDRIDSTIWETVFIYVIIAVILL
ncbi:MAG: phosphatidate cytidylyltransferase [Clostridia bacterium]|nr:phosphatidate cytidylyltransferase [Clostridia bacterium]